MAFWLAKLPRTKFTRAIFFLTGDIIFISLAVILAFALRFDGDIPFEYGWIIWRLIALSVVFYLPFFYFGKIYSFSWSYVSATELVSLFKATSFGFIFLMVALYLSRDFPAFSGLPRSTLVISYFLTFIFTGALRFSKRIYLNLKHSRQSLGIKLLIVGAGDEGEQLARNIIRSEDGRYSPVGFIDNNASKRGQMIHGIKVLGGMEKMAEIIKDTDSEEVVIAFPTGKTSLIHRVIEEARGAGIKKIRILPPNAQTLAHAREVNVEDLLGRDPIPQDRKEIEAFIVAKNVLITGAAGSIGSELARQVIKFYPKQLVLIDQDESGLFNVAEELKNIAPKQDLLTIVSDITNDEQIKTIFHSAKPQLVFHAAAYKHVPLMEEQPDEAVKNNIFGTKSVAEAALLAEAEKFIFISTDKSVNPTSVMGVTKRVGEKICQLLNKQNKTKFISVRFGNVLDSRGSVIPIFKEQIKRGGPVTVTHPEMKRYFMLTSEAVLLVLEAASIGNGGEVLVLDMGQPIKIVDLAKDMIRYSGYEPDRDIAIVYSGMRPGEKLFEEFLTAEEGVEATKCARIFVAKLSQVNEEEVINGLETLKELRDKELIKKTLKLIVPSYTIYQK
ncbi:MAG: nucleoside-diphosphate sugar epimerase/dehydratase [bacterium]